MVFGKAADPEHTEAKDTSLLIHAFHDGIVRCGPHEAWSLPKLDFQVISFSLKPDFHFFGHSRSPGFN